MRSYRLFMEGRQQSIAVILSAGGATLDVAALADVPNSRVVRAEFARGDHAVCVAATLEHECESSELLRALRPWAASRGWSVTVASARRPR